MICPTGIAVHLSGSGFAALLPGSRGISRDFHFRSVHGLVLRVVLLCGQPMSDPARCLPQDRSQPPFIEGLFELVKLLDDRVLLRFEHQIQAAEDDEGQEGSRPRTRAP
jgi:hypothetical protein